MHGAPTSKSAIDGIFKRSRWQRSRLLAISRALVSANAARSVALLLILAGGVGLLGWVVDVSCLMQPLRLFPRLPC